MSKLCLAVLLLLPPGLWATTYNYTGNPYTSINNNTTCTVGTCETFSTAMRITGSFTTATPLAANLAQQDITTQVTSYSFSDGVTTFASTDPNARLYGLVVSTDGNGQMKPTAELFIELWKTGTAPHSAGNRLDYMAVFSADDVAQGNDSCNSVGTSPGGTPDSCTVTSLDSSSSTASSNVEGPWTTAAPPPAGVPTLSEWGEILLATLLGLTGWMMMRRLA